MSQIRLWLLLFLVTVCWPTRTVWAEPLLAGEIDKQIAAKAQGPMSGRSSDHEFLRRIYLDLAGRIPSTREAREFLSDTAANKRAKLIDRLLASADYPRRMTDAFQSMLMERQGDNAEWQKFLHDSFAANKPWDQLVREILYPDPENEATRASAFFITKRLDVVGQNVVDYPGLVRDIGRLFMGIDVQCAQCHDHLFVDDYKQEHFQGLFAFLQQVSIRRDVKFPAVAEKLVTKKIEFASVFTKEPKATGPRLPGGEELMIPVAAKGEEYVTPPDRKTNFPGVPRFSPLKVLAEQLPRPENRLFARNIANRLWWLMMGRGLVQPLDLDHSANPPSHPEVLDQLAAAMIEHKFDVKWLLKELALSETYQRSSVLPAGTKPEDVKFDSYRTALERPLLAEQLLYSSLQATEELAGLEKNTTTLNELRLRFAAALANPAKEPEIEFAPSVKGALFLSNDAKVLSWLAPRDGNLVGRLEGIAVADEVANELYLAILTREPSAEERAEVASYLAKFKDRRGAALSHLAWALLTSTEFCLNH